MRLTVSAIVGVVVSLQKKEDKNKQVPKEKFKETQTGISLEIPTHGSSFQ